MKGPGSDIIVDSIAEAVITTDAGYVVTSWNRAAEAIYGYTAAEAVGRSVSELVRTAWESDQQREESLYAMRKAGHWTGEVVQHRRDGQAIRVYASVTLLFDGRGNRDGMVAVNRDVTSQRRAEATLAQVQAHLTEMQRTDALGQLAGSVAHDFNNLLAIIGGHAELALGKIPEGHPAQRSIRQIMSSVRRGAALTHQLLSFGRRDHLDVQAVNLVALIRGIDEVLQRVIGPGHSLAFELPEEPVWVRARAAELEQVLINLCANARDALLAPGQVHIALSCSEDDAVALSVRDDGVGMSAEVRANAFEPFYTTKAPGHGSGLGLAVVARVASRAGGSASLKSEPGQGTEVTLVLPRCAPAIERLVASAPPERRPLRILLAEDQELVLEVLAELLKRLGHQVGVARSGAEAVALGTRERFDVLVTDVSMPGLSGPAAAAALAQNGHRVPVVYVSGFPRNDDAFRAANWPQGVWRQKPVSLESLRTALDEALGGTRGSA